MTSTHPLAGTSRQLAGGAWVYIDASGRATLDVEPQDDVHYCDAVDCPCDANQTRLLNESRLYYEDDIRRGLAEGSPMAFYDALEAGLA
jgi:hypothetical protein